MKTSQTLIVTLAMGAAPMLACAQQSAPGVQVYGTIAAGVNHRTHQSDGDVNEVAQSPLAASLLGFRGREDLGDGMAAFFAFETGLGNDTGTSGAVVANSSKFFNRMAIVGLGDPRFGTLTIGRQFHAGVDRVIRSLDVYNVAGTTIFSTPLALHGTNHYFGNDGRADNSVKWRIDGPAGWSGALSYAFGEGTVGKSYSVDIAQTTSTYSAGAYAIRYLSPTPVPTTGDVPAYQVVGAGGNVKLGPVQPYLLVMSGAQDPSTATGAKTRNRIGVLGLKVPVSVWTLRASYTRDKGTNLNAVQGRDGTKTSWVSSAEYFVSKRTSLWGAYMRSSFQDGYRLDPINIGALARDPNASSTAMYSVGVRHDF